MTTTCDRLRRAELILSRVRSLPEASRARAIDAACSGDRALAAEVRSLLAHSDRLGAFLQEPALGTDFTLVHAAAGDENPGDAMVGRRVGHYRIDRRIASGGMGTVYLAQRADDEFTQAVAIKIVKRGMDSEEILRRFRHERQTLAALNHANIARLIDGGATDSGQPYLVMEYVEGLPIDEYCDGRRLSVDGRLRLFLTVCEAVRHAHQSLVVHRDLKPGNILVTPDGIPKLLDFGIATVIDRGIPARSTSVLERRLTPEYASPEQVAGRPVRTTSDVYSLGVILYELLTGRRPYRFSTPATPEIERVLDGEEPAAPSESVVRAVASAQSERADAGEPTPAERAGARGTTPERLRRRLRGDLDTIVLAAMRKQPERRYASVEQLADDLRRHLEGLPVSARKDSVRYRAAKFVRRRALATTLAGLSLSCFVVAAVVIGWQARLAARQRDEAFLARDQAEAITTFLQDMVASADPARRGAEVTVHEVLDDAARRLDTELTSQPLVQAKLRSTIGRTYLALGVYGDAELVLRQAYAQRLALLGPRHHDVAESMSDLASLLYARGGLDEAVELLRGALEIFRALRGEENTDVAKTLSSLGAVLRAQGSLAASESAQRRALEIRRALTGPDSTETAESLNNLAGVFIAQGRFGDAEAALVDALEIRRQRLGERHPLFAQAVDNLAVLLHRKGEHARAESLYRQALALETELLGEFHPDVAITQRNLGLLLCARGELAAAEDLLRRCLTTRTMTFASADSRVITAQLELAEILAADERWQEAEPLLEAVIAAAEDPAASPETRASALARAADLLDLRGDEARAARLRAQGTRR